MITSELGTEAFRPRTVANSPSVAAAGDAD